MGRRWALDGRRWLLVAGFLSACMGGAAPAGSAGGLEEARIDAMGFHPVVPVVERLAVDPLGRIWVQRSGPRPGDRGPTDVLTPDGSYLGTISPGGLRIPAALGPDGRMAMVVRDELGVETIQIVRHELGAPR